MSSGHLSEEISAAIAAKSGGAASSSMLWKSILGSALADGIFEATLLSYVHYFASPRLFARFMREHARAGESLGKTLDAAKSDCDELGISVEAFFRAVETVLAHLESSGRRAKPSTVTGYVYCTAEYALSRSELDTLPELVAEMLERHGFDG